MTLLLVLAALAALYLFLIAPCRKRPDASALEGWLYAHRGLHDSNAHVPENSLAAFRRAVEAGYGMELDVQLTKDDHLVVHHDGSLKRVCGVDKNIRDLTYQELCAIPLPDGSKIPLFSEVLELVAGRTPLIVEVKHHGGAARNAAATLRHLKAYNGAYCVESFDPLAMAYFKKHAPQIVRGQLAYGGKWQPEELGLAAHFCLKHLLVNCVSRPHFVAYSVPTDHTLSMWLMKRVFRPLLAGWTIRSQQVLDESLQKGYRYPIFETFIPQKRKPDVMYKLCWMKDFYGHVNEYFYDGAQNSVYYLNLTDYNRRKPQLTPTALLLLAGPAATLAQRLLGGRAIAASPALRIAGLTLLLASAALLHMLYSKSEDKKAAYIREHGACLRGEKERLISLFREGRTYRLGVAAFCLLCLCLFPWFTHLAVSDGALLFALMGWLMFDGAVIWLEMLAPVQWFRFKRQLKQMK